MYDLDLTFKVHSTSTGIVSNERQYMTSYSSLIVIISVFGFVSEIQAIYHMTSESRSVGQAEKKEGSLF